MRQANLALAGLCIALMSCGLIGKDFPLKKKIQVDVPAGTELCSTKTVTIDLSDEAGYQELKDNIGSVTVEKIALRVTNPKTQDDSVATSMTGELQLALEQGGTRYPLGAFTEAMPIADGSEIEVPVDQEGAVKLADHLVGTSSLFYLDAKGCVDAAPAHFEVEYEITANAKLK